MNSFPPTKMSRDKTSDLFAEGAKLYANPSIRPCYPTELFDKIYKFCGPNRGMALDVATGSGQCARELAKVFDQVVAIDVSEQQIKQCNPGPNLSYQIASAERTEQPDNSVDLVTVATALHWFKFPDFYHEVRRVLKPGPGSAFAAWAYELPQIKGNAAACKVVVGLNSVFSPYYEGPHKAWLDQYRGIQPQTSDFQVITRDRLVFEGKSSIALLVCPTLDWTEALSMPSIFSAMPTLLVESFLVMPFSSNSSAELCSAVNPQLPFCFALAFYHTNNLLQVQFIRTTGILAKMKKDAPEVPDPVPKFQDDLLSAFGTQDLDYPLTLLWPTFMILAKHPVPL